MGVTLPSDLIVEVMRNADPVRMKTAQANLQSLESADEFSDMLASKFVPPSGSPQLVITPSLQDGLLESPIPSGGAQAPMSPEAYVQFERMVLRNLLESLLPNVGSGVFGTGPTAGVWRSLAADQLASLYADAGGIGIASALAAEGKAASGLEQNSWPFFSTDKIEAFTG
jgi:flagellar protein FlgJ